MITAHASMSWLGMGAPGSPLVEEDARYSLGALVTGLGDAKEEPVLERPSVPDRDNSAVHRALCSRGRGAAPREGERKPAR